MINCIASLRNWDITNASKKTDWVYLGLSQKLKAAFALEVRTGKHVNMNTVCISMMNYTKYDVPRKTKLSKGSNISWRMCSISSSECRHYISHSVSSWLQYLGNIWRAIKLDRCKNLSETNTSKTDPDLVVWFKLIFGKPAIVFWLVRCGETDVEISNYIADKGRDWHAPPLSLSTLQKETHLPTTEVAVFCKNPCL